MTTTMVSPANMPTISQDELTACGWKMAPMMLPDGRVKDVPVPLTEAEFLHPEEGYHMPINTFHHDITATATDILTRRYASEPTVAVFSDLKIEWDHPELLPHSPDVYVVLGIRNKDARRSIFVVADEGTRPALIFEVVSPRYRVADRVTKLEEYELAEVPEYVIVDSLRRRGQTTDEILGYHLERGRFRPIVPDDEGRIRCRTVGLWLSMRDGRLVMEDAETGERLLTSQELEDENAQLRERLRVLEAELTNRTTPPHD